MDRPLLAEQLLLDDFPPVDVAKALVISPGYSQIAARLEELGSPACTAWYLDLYDAAVASAKLASEATNVEVTCAADLPEEEFGLVAFPTMKRGEAELTRDLMQQAHQRLADGGWLVTSVDHPKDQWLHQEMQTLFDKVSCNRTKRGCIYWAKKTHPLKKVRDFQCEFQVRDEERSFKLITRPGVFSHRRLDLGARQLMLCSEVGENDRVLEMGCGAGAAAISAAFRTAGQVIGVDSNARAVECLATAAQLNGLENVCTKLNADGDLELDGQIDLALANPPYYGDNRIAQHFVDTCVTALRPGGALLVVTQSPSWYESYFQDRLEDLAVFESSKYFVACGRKP